MNTKRKLLAIVLTLCMALSLVPVGALAEEPEPAGEPYSVSTWADLQAAFSNGGDYILEKDVKPVTEDPSDADKNPLTVPEDKTVTLDLNGFKIDRGLTEPQTNGNVITVKGTLTVQDTSSNKTGQITGGNNRYYYNETYSTQFGGGVFIDGGTFTLSSGSITGNKAGTQDGGGGVFVSGETKGTFIMDGGAISKNESGRDGGGVYIDNGEFTLNGGTISQNKGSENGYGGGVFGKTGTFIMNDGEISQNTAGNDGGGIYAYADFEFTMQGGKITQNTAGDGGGVSGGTFTMTSGTITDNTAVYEDGHGGDGGGVYVGTGDGGAFTMQGGKITQNKAGDGGGVYVCYKGTFTMENGIIEQNSAALKGNGVCVSDANGEGKGFIMNGGEIKSNTPLIADADAVQNDPDAVFGEVRGGGVFVEDSTFLLNGGTIADNVSTDGGGVYASLSFSTGYTGAFIMTGGTISGNKTLGAGGGVNLSKGDWFHPGGGEFMMTGGIITGNESYGQFTDEEEYGPQCGGGVYIGSGSFYMGKSFDPADISPVNYTGIVISKSKTTPTITENRSDQGGGVYLPENAEFIVQGDLNISQNKAGEWQGSGLARTLSNSSDDNVYLCKLGEESDNPVAPICVWDKLTNQTPIGVTTEIKPTQGNPIVFTRYLNGLDSDPENVMGAAANFKSDDPAYEVNLDESEQGIINIDEYGYQYSSRGEAILSALWKVTFESNGGSEVEPQYVKNEGYATAPSPAPTRPGYTLEGWYRDDGLTEKVTISTYSITDDTTFYANWKQNSSNPPSGPTTYKITVNPAENGTVTASKSTAHSGETITVTLAPAEGYQRDTVTVVDKKNAAVTTSGDGNTVTFKMPASDVTVTGTFKASSVTPPGGGSHWNDCPKDETCPIYPFTDANPKDWYHDGMHYCLDVGYVVGFGNFILGPNTPATRAQLVQILWNMEGNPAVDYQYTFEDVPADAWYASAVRWAASEGVIEGYSDKAFGPNDVMTREQFVTILFRYAGNNGADVSARADLSGYDDAAKVSDWAKDAMEWAVANGIVVGRTETTLSPQGSLTRAELTTIIQRYETKLTDKAA